MERIRYERYDPAVAELEKLIAPPDDTKLYGIIDASAVENFLSLAENSFGEYQCLFAGDVDPEVAEAAPYLVELLPRTDLLHQWWSEGWGEYWGIMAHIPAEHSFEDVRMHFRTFLRVRVPEGKYVLFRYYDPRIFRLYLPTCNAEEVATVFGPVSSYFAEDKEMFGVLRFVVNGDGLEVQRARLTEREGSC